MQLVEFTGRALVGMWTPVNSCVCVCVCVCVCANEVGWIREAKHMRVRTHTCCTHTLTCIHTLTKSYVHLHTQIHTKRRVPDTHFILKSSAASLALSMSRTVLALLLVAKRI